MVIFCDSTGLIPDPARVVIVGPTWPGRPGFPSAVERYTVHLPSGGELALKRRLAELCDGRERAVATEPVTSGEPARNGPIIPGGQP